MDEPTKLDAALNAAKTLGPVFPLKPNSKIPAINNWRNLATSDEKQIRQWWVTWPDANIAVTTDHLLVVDIDPRNGGDNSIRLLEMERELPKTAETLTAGGGRHLIYALPKGQTVRGGRDVLGRGIDVKSFGGYIVAPGSTIDGKTYTAVN